MSAPQKKVGLKGATTAALAESGIRARETKSIAIRKDKKEESVAKRRAMLMATPSKAEAPLTIPQEVAIEHLPAYCTGEQRRDGGPTCSCLLLFQVKQGQLALRYRLVYEKGCGE